MLSVGVVLLQFMKRIWSEFKLIARFPWMSPMSNQLPKKKGHTWTPFGIHSIDVCVRIRPNPFKTTPLKNTWVCFSVPIINMEQKKKHTHSWLEVFFRSKIPMFSKLPLFWRPKPWNFWTPPLSSRASRRSKRFPSQRPGKSIEDFEDVFWVVRSLELILEFHKWQVPFYRRAFHSVVSIWFIDDYVW